MQSIEVTGLSDAEIVMFHFAMDAEIAARLRSEIEAAETSVREHPTQTRQ